MLIYRTILFELAATGISPQNAHPNLSLSLHSTFDNCWSFTERCYHLQLNRCGKQQFARGQEMPLIWASRNFFFCRWSNISKLRISLQWQRQKVRRKEIEKKKLDYFQSIGVCDNELFRRIEIEEIWNELIGRNSLITFPRRILVLLSSMRMVEAIQMNTGEQWH